MRSLWWTPIFGAAVLFAAPFALSTQDSQAAQGSQAPAAASPAAPPPSFSGSGAKKYRHANDFLIRGSVFDEKGLSFPGAQLRIRRVAEKKFRWESYTNSRGEFAVRVPQGSDYEIVVLSKSFAPQTRSVDAKTGAREESVVFRLEPAGVKK